MTLQEANQSENRIIVDQDVIDFFNQTETTREYYQELCEKEIDDGDAHYNFIFYETLNRKALEHYAVHHDVFNDLLTQLYQYHKNLITQYMREDNTPEAIAIELANEDIKNYLDQSNSEYLL